MTHLKKLLEDFENMVQKDLYEAEKKLAEFRSETEALMSYNKDQSNPNNLDNSSELVIFESDCANNSSETNEVY